MFGVNVAKRTKVNRAVRMKLAKVSASTPRPAAGRQSYLDRQHEQMSALRKWAFEGIEP
jgi:hypothetical protein